MPVNLCYTRRIHRFQQESVDYDQKRVIFILKRTKRQCPRCASSIAFYLRDHRSIRKFKLEPQPDGSVIIELQPAIEHEVIRWVLGEAGRIEVLAPAGRAYRGGVAGPDSRNV